MILFILTLFAQADETKTEVDFEAVEVTGKLQKPSFAYVEVLKRPVFNSAADFCIRTSFQDKVMTIE